MSNNPAINNTMKKIDSNSNNCVDDTQTVIASSHLLIRDKQSQQILINQRGS
jgi:hypothetical protein